VRSWVDKAKVLLSGKLARNASWSFFGQMVSIVLQAGYFVVIARLLGSTNYGIYTGAFALVSIVSQYSSLGSGFVFLRRVSADPASFSKYWGNILTTTLTFGTLLVGVLVLVGHFAISSVHASLILFIAIGDTVCQQLISTVGQVFQAFENLRTMATLNMSMNVLRFALALGLFISLNHASAYQWAFASMLVSVVAAICAIVAVSVTFGRPTFSFRTVFEHISEGFVFSLSGSTTYIYNDLDKVMLGHYGMNAANGIYTTAYRVLNICTTPITSIHNATFPRFFQLGTKGARATEPFARKVLRKTTLFGIAGAIGMFAFAPIIPHLVGKSFAESVVALRWLCLIPLFRCFHLSAGDALAGAGYQNYRLVTRICAAVLNFGLNLILIPRFSWLGAAWASLATDGGLGVIDWVVIRWLISREKSRSAQVLEFA
jgi:O-antigen/teichoic acid export membrane protein